MTVATVGQSAITKREVENYQLLLSLEVKKEGKKVTDSSDADKTRNALIQQVMIKNYLVSTGLLHPITPAELAAARREINYEKNKSLFDAQGIDSQMLDQMLEDRLHERMFFEKLIPSRVVIMEKDLHAYYNEKKDSRFLGKPYASVESIVRADLKRDRVEKEFNRWLETEKRHTEIILLPSPENRKTPAP